MTLYYFHVRDSKGFMRDEEGQHLSNVDAVRERAVASIRTFIGHELEKGVIDLGGAVEVTDGEGRPVMTIRFDQAVTVKPPR